MYPAVELLTKIMAKTGPTNDQMRPLSNDSQHLVKYKVINNKSISYCGVIQSNRRSGPYFLLLLKLLYNGHIVLPQGGRCREVQPYLLL